ncbi:hypothetical protein [Aquipuribacter hungaricus]|uniref:Uncharacterized protein n=2 Tax=Aquipuribacter hungaricus TaxID=545624 RepID=A0ABV7WGG8_9MICO
MTLPGRLALLVVLVAGFLTMHGFFAVSAGADEQSTGTVSAESGVSVSGGHAWGHPADPVMTTLVDAPAAGDTPQPGSNGAPPPSPHPADHHDLLAGCVVALVGIAVLTLAHLLSRRGPLVVGRSRVTVARVVSWVGDHAPAPPPPRIALCVIRV